MQCVAESGGVLVTVTAEPCPGWVLLTPAEAQAVIGQVTTESVAQIGVTAESLAGAFVMGFGWVVVAAALAWSVGLAVELIRKA